MIIFLEGWGLWDSEAFKNSALGNWEQLLPIALAVGGTVSILLLIVLIRRIWRRRRRHQILLDDLAVVHRLTAGEKKFLVAAARERGLEMPELIFVMRSAFEEHVATVQPRNDWVEPLRQKLYGGPVEPSESSEPVEEEDMNEFDSE